MKKRSLVLLLVALWIMGLLVFMPKMAHAASADDLTFQINHTYAHGGTGTLSATQSGNTVTVTGAVTHATQSLNLALDAGVKVIWQAVFSGSANGLINLSGSGKGTFEVVKGGVITSSAQVTVYNPPSSSCQIQLDGGEVTNTGEEGAAIRSNAAKAKVTVKNGRVTATGKNGTAISLAGSGSSLEVSGGRVGVSSDSVLGHAIFSGAATTTITVDGGIINAYRDAIYLGGDNATVKVNGGEIRTDGGAVGTGIYIAAGAGNAKVGVKGGKIYSLGSEQNHAICSDGADSELEISGGLLTTAGTYGTVCMRGTAPSISVSDKAQIENTGSGDAIWGNGLVVSVKGGSVSAQEGYGIRALDVTVSGGKVTASGGQACLAALSAEVTGGSVQALGTGHAISVQSLEVKGGTVSAKSGFAADMAMAGSFKASGGFVFAYGKSSEIVGNVIKMDSGAPTLSGQAVLCVWDSPGGKPVFTEGTSTNLFVNAGASARWGLKDGQPGIHYQRGSNQGFFVIGGVTIIEAPATSTPTSPETSTSSPESSLTSQESMITTLTETSPSQTPSMTEEETQGGEGITGDEKTGGFNCLWLLPIALVIIAIALGLTYFIVRRKGHEKL